MWPRWARTWEWCASVRIRGTQDLTAALRRSSSRRMISDASAEGGSYAGSDTRTEATALIREQADEVVAKLYSDYCSKAGLGEGRRGK